MYRQGDSRIVSTPQATKMCMVVRTPQPALDGHNDLHTRTVLHSDAETTETQTDKTNTSDEQKHEARNALASQQHTKKKRLTKNIPCANPAKSPRQHLQTRNASWAFLFRGDLSHCRICGSDIAMQPFIESLSHVDDASSVTITVRASAHVPCKQLK